MRNLWCLTSDVDGHRMASPKSIGGAKDDYMSYLRDDPDAEGDIFIENIDSGDQLCWNPHTETWDEL